MDREWESLGVVLGQVIHAGVMGRNGKLVGYRKSIFNRIQGGK